MALSPQQTGKFVNLDMSNTTEDVTMSAVLLREDDPGEAGETIWHLVGYKYVCPFFSVLFCWYSFVKNSLVKKVQKVNLFLLWEFWDFLSSVELDGTYGVLWWHEMPTGLVLWRYANDLFVKLSQMTGLQQKFFKYLTYLVASVYLNYLSW